MDLSTIVNWGTLLGWFISAVLFVGRVYEKRRRGERVMPLWIKRLVSSNAVLGIFILVGLLGSLGSLYLSQTRKVVNTAIPAGATTTSKRGALTYVWVPPGKFKMGCVPGDTSCEVGEHQHDVTISKGFWLGQTEVTVAAYRKYANAMAKAMPPEPKFNAEWKDGNQPIVNLTWSDAKDFCGWDDNTGRLPTEAEWEYAARGRSETLRYGDVDEIAWNAHNSGMIAHPVAQKPANYLGLYDMLGNAWEWVNDRWAEDYYEDNLPPDPKGPTEGTERVLRGGSYRNPERHQRFSNRNRESNDDKAKMYNTFGVRCARD
jgi:formylglycine-generating enzyme required for sulfatase activity